MAQRPARKKALTAPAPQRDVSPIAGRSTLPSTTVPATEPPAKSGPQRPKPNLTKKRLQPYVEPEINGRLRGAYKALGARDQSFSDFIAQMLIDRLSHLEKSHNDGQPFPLNTEKLRTGPRIKFDD